MSTWERIVYIWSKIQAQFANLDGIDYLKLYDEILLYDKINIFKRLPLTKTNFTRR